MKKILLTGILLAMTNVAIGAPLDSKGATVSMQVGKFAKISELNNFVLNPVSTDGDALSIYTGSDAFRLEANCPVILVLSGGNLTNGRQELATTYQLDDGTQNVTSSDPMHDKQHKVSASAQLGNISQQEAGNYAANITITVSAL